MQCLKEQLKITVFPTPNREPQTVKLSTGPISCTQLYKGNEMFWFWNRFYWP